MEGYIEEELGKIDCAIAVVERLLQLGSLDGGRAKISFQIIGTAAVEEGDAEARKYLFGLLFHSNIEARFYAIIYLDQVIMTQEEGLVWDSFLKNPKNRFVLYRANQYLDRIVVRYR